MLKNLARIVYYACAVMLLLDAFGVAAATAGEELYANERALRHDILLTAFGFPSTLVLYAVLTAVIEVGQNLESWLEVPHIAELVAIWMLMVLVGYCQWFVWVPMLYQRWRQERPRR